MSNTKQDLIESIKETEKQLNEFKQQLENYNIERYFPQVGETVIITSKDGTGAYKARTGDIAYVVALRGYAGYFGLQNPRWGRNDGRGFTFRPDQVKKLDL